MRDIIIFALIFGCVPFILMRPYIGVLVWSWLGYMNPHRLAYGAAYDFPFAQLVGLATLVALVVRPEKKKLPITPVTIVWFLLVFWMNVTYAFALVPDDAALEWDRVMKIQLFAFLSIVVLHGKERINYLIIIIVLSIGFFAVKGGIFSILTGGGARVYGPPGSFIEDNNQMGLAILMILPLMIYLFTQLEAKHYRLAMLGAIGISVLSALTTQSRGALVAIGATVGFLWMKSQRKAVIGLVILLMTPIFLMAMPDSWHDRMATIATYEQDESAMGRINAWYYAFNLAADRPLVGGGFMAFTPELFEKYAPQPDDFHDAHSIYFEMLAEHGFVGLGLFLLLGILSLRLAGQIVRMTSSVPDLKWANTLAKMLQASLVAYASGGMFLGLAYFDLYYHLIALLVLLREHVVSELAPAQHSAVPKNPFARRTARKPASSLAPGAEPPAGTDP